MLSMQYGRWSTNSNKAANRVSIIFVPSAGQPVPSADKPGPADTAKLNKLKWLRVANGLLKTSDCFHL
jgi:hypothetical protein